MKSCKMKIWGDFFDRVRWANLKSKTIYDFERVQKVIKGWNEDISKWMILKITEKKRQEKENKPSDDFLLLFVDEWIEWRDWLICSEFD